MALRPIDEAEEDVLLGEEGRLHDELTHHEARAAEVDLVALVGARRRARGDAPLAKLGVQAGQVRVQLQLLLGLGFGFGLGLGLGFGFGLGFGLGLRLGSASGLGLGLG